MAFQYPVEVPGVSNSQFLRLAYNEKAKHHGIEELDPLAGIAAGVLRSIDGRAAWRPEETLTVEQALHATCVAPTYLSRDERRRGRLLPGLLADLVVLERHHPDPYENVCLADPSWVELVCIGGDVTYGRAEWFGRLSGAATGTTIEDLTAWGKPMRLDTGFQGGTDVPSLTAVRTALTAAYPAVGPIFA